MPSIYHLRENSQQTQETQIKLCRYREKNDALYTAFQAKVRCVGQHVRVASLLYEPIYNTGYYACITQTTRENTC